MGGRHLPRGKRRRIADGLRVQWQRHAACARVPAAAPGLLQSGSEVVRRPPLPTARRTLAPILDTIERLHALGLWLEIVTLLIPGFNDSPDEIDRLTAFIAGVSQDIPWHVTAFHQDYQMTDRRDTTDDDLLSAAAIGRRNGLRFVYAGNRPGRVGALEHTACPSCGQIVIERLGYHINAYRLTPNGGCPSCGAVLPGRWDAAFAGQRIDRPTVWRRRA